MYQICVFGDSISFGRGDNLNRGWCGRLRKYFEVKDYYNCLQNLSICGDTTKTLLKRFDCEAKARIKFLRSEDRNIIIIAIGLNDSRLSFPNKLYDTKIAQFRKNIIKLCKKAKKFTEEVTFIGLTPVDEEICNNYEESVFSNNRINEFNNTIKEICEKNNIPFLDIFQEFSKSNYTELLDDGLHINSKGYEKMYELIKIFLVKNNLIEK